jgi:hypothetical protein
VAFARSSGLVLRSGNGVASCSRSAIIGSKNLVSAPTPQQVDGRTYKSVSWSNSRTQSHEIIAAGVASTYNVTYSVTPKITSPCTGPEIESVGQASITTGPQII